VSKLVPNKSAGASRRSYQHGYSKSATNVMSDILGKSKLRTPAFAQPKGAAKITNYAKRTPYLARDDDPYVTIFKGKK